MTKQQYLKPVLQQHGEVASVTQAGSKGPQESQGSGNPTRKA